MHWVIWVAVLVWVLSAVRWRPVLRLPYALLQWFVSGLAFLILIVIGFFVVAIALKRGADMAKLPVWGNREHPEPPDWFRLKNRPFPNWWWFAIRNPVNNLRYYVSEPKPERLREYFGTVQEIDIGIADPMEQPGWRWRYRYSIFLDSFRCTWGPARGVEGKREFYIGWKIGSSTPGVGFAFSPRPFPIIWWTNLKQRIRGLFG